MIVQATLAAIEKAATEYVSLSGGESSWSARESFYTTCIARKIGRLRNAPLVTLEQPISDAMKAAGCRRRRKHWGKERFDIVLWDDESPTAVIEVKRVSDFRQNAQRDVKRICHVLNELTKNKSNNSFQYGILAHLVSGQTTDSNGQLTFGHLKRRIRDSSQQIERLLEEHGQGLRVTSHVRRIPPDDYGREFAAVVHRISRLHPA